MEKTKKADNMPKTTMWTDIKAYFEGQFNSTADLQTIELKADELVKTFKEQFAGKYNPEVIAELLRKGFEVVPGVYVFKRSDFIAPPVREVPA